MLIVSKKTKTSPYNHSVTSYKLHTGNPWDHTALGLDKDYVSVRIGGDTPAIDDSYTEEDLPYKIRDFSKKIVGPMVYSIFEINTQKDELKQYPHESVNVRVTGKQLALARHLTNEHKRLGAERKLHYSIFRPLGVSCAESSQQVLNAITKGTPEEPLARLSPIERWSGITWPQATHQRFIRTAEAREHRIAPETINTKNDHNCSPSTEEDTRTYQYQAFSFT